jgi:hypothetical protein
MGHIEAGSGLLPDMPAKHRREILVESTEYLT